MDRVTGVTGEGEEARPSQGWVGACTAPEGRWLLL